MGEYVKLLVLCCFFLYLICISQFKESIREGSHWSHSIWLQYFTLAAAYWTILINPQNALLIMHILIREVNHSPWGIILPIFWANELIDHLFSKENKYQGLSRYSVCPPAFHRVNITRWLYECHPRARQWI